MSPGSQERAGALVRFAYEAGHLARTPRTGWQLAAVDRPESVAVHSYRVGVIAYLVAHEEGADADHAAALGLFHDLPEARTGDLNSVAKRYTTVVDPRAIAADQVDGLPPRIASHIIGLIDEFEKAKEPVSSTEACCARDADKLDCLLVAREYSATGNAQLQPWIDTMAAALRTPTGRRLAHDAQQVEPGEWWYDTVSTYGMAFHPQEERRTG